MPSIRYLLAHYGFSPEHPHIAVPSGAREVIQKIGEELSGTQDLIAIYIPEGTEDHYNPGKARGRLVGTVRLLSMPIGDSVESYFYGDWANPKRWPFGWPCKVVHAPSVDESPSLREHVETELGPGAFGGFVSPFQRGPIPLYRYEGLKLRIERDFAALGEVE